MKNFIRFTPGNACPVDPLTPKGMRKTVLARPTVELPFLHDTTVTPGCGIKKPLAAWYACTQGEIVGETCIRGLRIDEAESLPQQQVIVGGSDFHYVPASLYESEHGTFAFVTKMTDHDLPVGYCVMHETENGWQRTAEYDDPVLINTNPIEFGSEYLLASGRICPENERYPIIPAVLVIKKSQLSPDCPKCEYGRWKIIPITTPETPSARCPETAVYLHKSDGQYTITALTRATSGRPLVHTAAVQAPDELYGKAVEWHYCGTAELPIAPVKMYTYTLPDGTDILLYNRETENGDRSKLHMALRRKGEECFSRVFTLGDGSDNEIKAGPFWHYPCAALRGDTLLVTCTANGTDNLRSAVLFEIPTSSLM